MELHRGIFRKLLDGGFWGRERIRVWLEIQACLPFIGMAANQFECNIKVGGDTSSNGLVNRNGRVALQAEGRIYPNFYSLDVKINDHIVIHGFTSGCTYSVPESAFVVCDLPLETVPFEGKSQPSDEARFKWDEFAHRIAHHLTEGWRIKAPIAWASELPKSLLQANRDDIRSAGFCTCGRGRHEYVPLTKVTTKERTGAREISEKEIWVCPNCLLHTRF